MELEAAAWDGDAAEVARLLAAGADVHANDDGALRAACEGGYADAIDRWVQAGGPANDVSALRAANEGGFRDVVALLLNAGADVHAKYDEPLRAACKCGFVDVVEMLLKAGAHVHAKTDATLREACTEGHTRIVELLLKAGADVHADNDEALCCACRGGFPDIVELLLAAGANPNPVDRWYDWPLSNAIYSGFRPNNFVRPLANDPNVDDIFEEGPVESWVCRRRHKEVIQKLLRAGAAVDFLFQKGLFYNPTREGSPPVHTADLLLMTVPTIGVGDGSLLLEASKAGQHSVADRLLTAGADPLASLRIGFQRPNDGGGANVYRKTLPVMDTLLRADPASFADPVDRLHYASAVGNVAVVQHALQAGVDVNRDNGLALRLACWAGHTAVVKCLLRAGAEIEIRGGDPLEQACGNGHLPVVSLLLAAGANVRVSDQALTKASENGHLAVVERLLTSRASLLCAFPPLSFAARRGHLFVVDRLLTAGANPNVNRAPLRLAAGEGHVDTVRRLLGAGAVNSNYALADAIRNGHLDVVDVLLTAGNATISHRVGNASVSSAVMDGRDDIVAFIFNAGFCGSEKFWQDARQTGRAARLITHVPRATYGALPLPAQGLWLRHHVPEWIRHRLCYLLQNLRYRLDRPPPAAEPLGTGTPTRDRLIAHLATAGRRFAREYWTEGVPIFFPGLATELGPVPEQFLFKPSGDS